MVSRRGNPMREKKKKDINHSSINRGARGNYSNDYSLVRSKRRDTSHLISYINLPGHISL